MSDLNNRNVFLPGELVRSRVSGLTGELLPAAGDGFARFRAAGSGMTVVCLPESLEPASPAADIAQARAEMAQADRLAALRAESEQFAAEVTQRVGDAIEASETPVLELLEGTGISVHRVAEVFDGRDCFTVSEVCVLTLAAGVTDLRALFGPITDEPEVAR